jgi:hypothetical protein
MAKSSKKKSERLGVTASGIVEAIEQDVELSVEQVKDAVVAVEKKLGVRKATKKPKPTVEAAKSSRREKRK